MTIEVTSEYQPPEDLICRAGHPVVASAGPKAKHCQSCGEQTISACEGCQAALPQFTGDLAAIGVDGGLKGRNSGGEP